MASTPPMTGWIGQGSVSIENAHTVGEVQTMSTGPSTRTGRNEIVQQQAQHDVEMAQMRVNMRRAQQDVRQAQVGASSGPHGTRLDLVDVEPMYAHMVHHLGDLNVRG